MHERSGGQHRNLLLKGRAVIAVEKADGDAVAPFEGSGKCRDAILGIVLGLDVVDALLIPVVGVDLVEGDAGLEDVNQRKAIVVHGLLHQAAEMRRVGGKGPGHEAAVERHGERHGVELLGDHAERGIFRLCSGAGCGRGLPLGQSVDLVVVDKELHVDVPADRRHEMVAAFAVAIAVAGGDDHRHGVVGEPDPCCHRQGPAVQAVEGVASGIVRQLGRLADARNQGDLMGFKLQIDHRLLERFQDREIAATRTPSRILTFIFFQGNHLSLLAVLPA